MCTIIENNIFSLYFTKDLVGGVQHARKNWTHSDLRFCLNEGSKHCKNNEKGGQQGTHIISHLLDKSNNIYLIWTKNPQYLIYWLAIYKCCRCLLFNVVTSCLHMHTYPREQLIWVKSGWHVAIKCGRSLPTDNFVISVRTIVIDKPYKNMADSLPTAINKEDKRSSFRRAKNTLLANSSQTIWNLKKHMFLD